MPARWETISASEFSQYVATLTFDASRGRRDVERACTPANAPECAAGQGRTRVDIDPEVNAPFLGPSQLHANGHVIARLRNRGRATEAKYNLPPGTTIYWLVSRGGAGAISRFVYVDQSGAKQVVRTIAFSACPGGESHPNRGVEASFARCPTTMQQVSLQGGQGDEPAWISCLEGCCVADLVN